MKLILIIFIIAGSIVLANNNSIDKLVEIECSRFYTFNDSVYDLSTLKSVQLKSKNSLLFKNCKENIHHFDKGKYGFELKSDSLLQDPYCKYEWVNNSTLKSTDPDYEVRYIDLPNKSIEGEKEIAPVVLSDYYGLILIYNFKDSTGYDIYKLNYKGEITHHLQIAHTELKEKDNSKWYDRYLYPHARNGNLLVFTSDNRDDETKVTIELNMQKMEIKKYSFQISSVVWNEYYAGGIAGFLLSPEKKYEEDSELKYFNVRDSSFTSLKIPYASEQCETYLHFNTLVVANYSRISTGCSLQAFDIRTKEKIWTADVIQLLVDHSKYYNTVFLSKFRNNIILEGQEAYGSYLQIFDITTGKRLAEFGDAAKK